jgi:hypothetical protein
MRSVALLLLMSVAVAAPTGAFAAKKAKAPVKPKVMSSTPENLNALSAKAVGDGLHQIFVPLEVTLLGMR